MTDAGAEVLVLGAGPAGSAAASLLARWGHRVIVRTKPRAETAALAESIPPSTRKLIDLIGLGGPLEAAGFVRSTGNTVWWGSRSPRVEPFPHGERGWQVTRRRLEAVLATHLASVGVRVESGMDAEGHRERPSVKFTLDCTGRSGLLARSRGLRVHEPAHRIVALAGSWYAAGGFPVHEPTHTLVESYDGGWAWSVPTSPDERVVACMVDPATSGLARGAAAREVYLREVARTSQMAALTTHATLAGRPVGWDASIYHASRYVDDDVLLVGDAASFVDPLSSAGIKKAFASGWLAAVAVHTSLRRPEMRAAALGFFAAREAEVYATLKAMAAETLAGAAAGHHHPFWSDRTDAGAAEDRRSAAAAFEYLRAQPALRVRLNPEARQEERAAVSGSEIVMETRLVKADRPEGIRHAFDVDLIGLIGLAPAHAAVPDLYAAYNRAHAPVALPDFLGALATALAQKWLLWV